MQKHKVKIYLLHPGENIRKCPSKVIDHPKFRPRFAPLSEGTDWIEVELELNFEPAPDRVLASKGLPLVPRVDTRREKGNVFPILYEKGEELFSLGERHVIRDWTITSNVGQGGDIL